MTIAAGFMHIIYNIEFQSRIDYATTLGVLINPPFSPQTPKTSVFSLHVWGSAHHCHPKKELFLPAVSQADQSIFTNFLALFRLRRPRPQVSGQLSVIMIGINELLSEGEAAKKASPKS